MEKLQILCVSKTYEVVAESIWIKRGAGSMYTIDLNSDMGESSFPGTQRYAGRSNER